MSRQRVGIAKCHERKSTKDEKHGLNLEGCRDSEQTDSKDCSLKEELMNIERNMTKKFKVVLERANQEHTNRIENLMKEVEKLKVGKEENDMKI